MYLAKAGEVVHCCSLQAAAIWMPNSSYSSEVLCGWVREGAGEGPVCSAEEAYFPCDVPPWFVTLGEVTGSECRQPPPQEGWLRTDSWISDGCPLREEALPSGLVSWFCLSEGSEVCTCTRSEVCLLILSLILVWHSLWSWKTGPV
jgi:hypothetical protein